MLRDMAVGADNPEEARVAVAGLSELRDLSDVARNAKFEEISQSALMRIDVQKTLASVSRRAVHPAVRLVRSPFPIGTIWSHHQQQPVRPVDPAGTAGGKLPGGARSVDCLGDGAGQRIRIAGHDRVIGNVPKCSGHRFQ